MDHALKEISFIQTEVMKGVTARTQAYLERGGSCLLIKRQTI